MTEKQAGVVNNDLWFGPMVAEGVSEADMVKAGWFDEQLNVIERSHVLDVRLPATPWNKLHFRPGVCNVVLVTTGAFDPLHDGHVAAMDAVSEALTREGRHVAGGYVCCDHDVYVATKHPDNSSGYQRVVDARHKLAGHTTLMVDPWPALHCTTSVNYTTVLERLWRHVHLRCKAELAQLSASGGELQFVYVFGGDNHGFGETFRYGPAWAQAACVQRGGGVSETVGDHVIVVGEVSDLSSTTIRQQKTSNMPCATASGTVYVVRDDLAQALAGFDETDVETFRKEMIAAFEEAVFPRTVMLENCSNQSQLLETHLEEVVRPAHGNVVVVSLDVWEHGDIQLELSRRFEAGDGQLASTGLVRRPESAGEHLERVRRAVGGRPYILVDDDIATGVTCQTAAAMIGHQPADVVALCGLSEMFESATIDDVVDLRDFCIPASYSGLVVGGESAKPVRYSYLSPAVDLSTRARMNQERIRVFCQRALDANHKLLAASKCTVGDLTEAQRNGWLEHGYEDGTYLGELAHHLAGKG